jgi:hypothetical protein
MFLDKYLTEYDDSLSGESYIDPLGALIIWSAYGQQIFKSRVNSISNDVRNYTLNLFNHYLIRRLIKDESMQLSKSLLSAYGRKDTLNFKYACLLYLENLFVYSILKHGGKTGIDSSGVLGITKARRIWAESDGKPRLVFSHGKDGQILVRQLSLGVSGRYKTPLMEIGYFDGNYHYHLPSSSVLWEEAVKFISGRDELVQLADVVIKHLRVVLNQNSLKAETSFSTVPDELHNAYANAFASPGAVGRYARAYWLEATGLDIGAAGALLQVLDENAVAGKPGELGAQMLMTMALEKELAPEEKIKMENIVLLEPFLADAMLLFILLTTKKSQPLAAVVDQWKKFGRDERTLPQGAQRVRNSPTIVNVLKGAARSRLQVMLGLADKVTMEDQVASLIDYHKKVMAQRGQLSWLSIDGGQVKLHVRPSRVPAEKDWPNGAWYNDYYLPHFKGLVNGYQGGTA